MKSTAQAPKAKRGTITLLCTGTSLTAASLYIYASTLPPYAETLGASLLLIGLIGGSYGFMQLLSRIPLGLLSDRGLRRAITIAGPALAGLGCLGFVFFRRPESFVAWRGLAGLGGAALVALPPTFAATLGSKQTTRAASLSVFFFGLGQTASAVAGGELAQHMGWQAPPLFGLVLAAGGVLTLSLASRHSPNAASGSQPDASRFLVTVRSPGVLLVIGLALIGNLTHMATVFTFVPVRAVALGASRSEVGLLAAATMGAMTAANRLCGTLLAGRVERRWIAALGLGLIGLGTVVLPWITAYGPLTVSQVISGFGTGLTVPPLLAAVLDAASPTRHGAASGLFQWGVSWGTFGGPAIGGLIAQRFGLDTTFLITGGLCLLAALYPIYRPLTVQDHPAGSR